LTDSAAGTWDVDLLPKVDAASAPAATKGIPTTAHQSHFLLLMIFLLFYRANWMTVVSVCLFSFSKKERQKKAHEPLLMGLAEFHVPL
jgi:hypothetical protein